MDAPATYLVTFAAPGRPAETFEVAPVPAAESPAALWVRVNVAGHRALARSRGLRRDHPLPIDGLAIVGVAPDPREPGVIAGA